MKFSLVPYPAKLKQKQGIYRDRPAAPPEEGVSDWLPTEGPATRFERVAGLPPQGYRLEVNEAGATIRYSDEDGKYYGAVTLGQLEEQFGDALPFLEIEDAPVTLWRGVQLCFGQFDLRWNEDWLKKFVRDMARVKVNAIVLYLEWNFQTPDLPFSENGVTIGQLKAFERLAKRYRITVVPAVNLLGHSSEILDCEAAAELGESDSALCPSHAGTLRLAERVVEALCELESPLIHVGGDEVGAYGKCPDCAKKFAEKGKLGIFLEYFGKINRMLKARGKRMGLWSDQILMLMEDCRFWIGCDREPQFRKQNFDLLSALADNLTVFDWWYEGENDAACDFWKSHGIRFVACGATNGYVSAGADPDQIRNLYNFYGYAQKCGCAGVLTTDWMSVNGTHAELMGVLFAAGAAIGWSGCGGDFTPGQSREEFLLAYSALRYGVKGDALGAYLYAASGFDGALNACLPEPCRGLALRQDVFMNHNPLRFYLERKGEWDRQAHRNALSCAEKLFEKAKSASDGREPCFDFLALPLLVHRFESRKAEVLDRALPLYRTAAKQQISGLSFEKTLAECAEILKEFIPAYEEPIDFCVAQRDFLGNDPDAEKRVRLQRENWIRFAEFVRGLADNRRVLPAVKSISEHLFDVCGNELYGSRSADWLRDGCYTMCLPVAKSYFCKNFRAEALRKDLQ